MKRQVLVLCTGNSARSQMAEAIINGRIGDAWEAVSAGTEPERDVNPAAVRALAEIGLEHADARPTHVDVFMGRSFDVVITVCDDAAERCPVWLGEGRRTHIGFPDPARADGTDEEIMAVFRTVRDDIERRVLEFLNAFSSSPTAGAFDEQPD